MSTGDSDPSTLDVNRNEVDHGEQVSIAAGAGPRSPEWPKVAREHLAKQPHCACCKPGTNLHAPLQVHHIFPFHYCRLLGRPDLELEPRNLITLCEDEAGRPGENHHLLVGHLDDFQSSNLEVEHDATKTFLGMAAAAIRVDPRWVAEHAARLPHIGVMTAKDKESFKAAMNAAFPRS
jgi:hypothetical protein